MRELVRTLVEFRIGQRFRAEADSRGLGRDRGLFGKDLVERFVLGITREGGVPVKQQFVPVAVAQQRQVREQLTRVSRERQQQVLIDVQPALDGGFVKQIRVVVAVQREALRRLHNVQKQVEVHKTLGALFHLAFETGKVQLVAYALEIELHFNQRQAAGIARNGEFADQSPVGVALVLVRIDQFAARDGKQFRELHVRGCFDADRQQVHAVADQSFARQRSLGSCGNADYDIALAGQARQQRLKARQQSAEQRRIVLSAGALDGAVMGF